LVGDRVFDEGLYEGAKLLFSNISNYSRLASTLLHLSDYSGAVDAARKANNTRTWREVNAACVDAGEFRLAQIAGLNLVLHADELDELIRHYEDRGYFDQIIQLMEAGMGNENAITALFTELAILYSKYKEEKLMEHLRLFYSRLNIPKVLRVCEANQQWEEVTFLYVNYDENESAVQTMILHAAEAWEHIKFKDVIVKVSNIDIYYKALNFYFEEQPLLINDLLGVLIPRIDHTKTVLLARKVGQLALIKPYLALVQENNVAAVNEAINQLYIEEEDYEALRKSIDTFDNFDNIALAQKIEKHDLLEFKRIAAYLYKKNKRWQDSVQLSKNVKLFKDAIETACDSHDQQVAENLLAYFVENKMIECFAATLYTCYDLIRPDVALELAWRNAIIDYSIPYLLQVLREYIPKIDKLEKKSKEAEEKAKAKEESKDQTMPSDYGMPNTVPGTFPPIPGMSYAQPILPTTMPGTMPAMMPGTVPFAAGIPLPQIPFQPPFQQPTFVPTGFPQGPVQYGSAPKQMQSGFNK